MWAAPLVATLVVWGAAAIKSRRAPQQPGEETAGDEELQAEEGGIKRTIRSQEFGQLRAAALASELRAAGQIVDGEVHHIIQGSSCGGAGTSTETAAVGTASAERAAASEVEARMKVLQLSVTKRSATALLLRRDYDRRWEQLSWVERLHAVRTIDTSQYEKEEDAWRRLVAMPSEVRAAAAAKHYNEWAAMRWIEKLEATEAVARDTAYTRACKKCLLSCWQKCTPSYYVLSCCATLCLVLAKFASFLWYCAALLCTLVRELLCWVFCCPCRCFLRLEAFDHADDDSREPRTPTLPSEQSGSGPSRLATIMHEAEYDRHELRMV